MMGDAGMRMAGGFEIDHNVIGKNWMLHGHPNGAVCAPEKTLFHHNIMFNTMDTMFYTAGEGQGTTDGIKVYDNLFYTTWDWSFVYTNEFSNNKPFVDHGTQAAFQFLVEANANNAPNWLPQYWTNFVFVNNTVMCGMGAVPTNLNAGIEVGLSTPNRYAPGNSLSVEVDLYRGWVYLTRFIIENNLFYNLAPKGADQVTGAIGGWVDRYNPDPNTWTNPAINFTSGISFDPADVVVDYNVFAAEDPGSERFYYNGPTSTSHFQNMEAFNVAYATNGYTHNSSAKPSLIDTNGYDFRPRNNDTAVNGKGQNLYDLTNTPGGMPDLFMDLAGVTRPAGAWTIGAYEPASTATGADPSLVLQLSFDDLASAATHPVSRDATGNGHDMTFCGFETTPTNWPTRVAYTNNMGGSGYAAQFSWSTNGLGQNGPGFVYGQFGAITNLGALTNLTAITVSAWVKYFPPPFTGSDGSATIIDVCYGTNGPTWSLGRNYSWQTRFDIFTNLDYNTDRSLHLSFPDDQSTDWHFYAATFDCVSQVMNIYFDGTNYASQNFTGYSPSLTNLTVSRPYSGGTYPGNDGWIAVGCRTHSGSPSIADGDGFPNNAWMDGQVHDLKVYNRALPANEISSLYSNSGAGGTPPVPKLMVIRDGPNTVVTWSTNSVCFTLQSATDLANWSASLPAPLVVNGQFTVTNPVSSTLQFFRLSQASTGL